MPEMNRAKYNPKELCSSNNGVISAEAYPNGLSVIGKLDGGTIIQAIVMMELLGKPKAKGRKRGRFSYEGTHSR